MNGSEMINSKPMSRALSVPRGNETGAAPRRPARTLSALSGGVLLRFRLPPGVPSAPLVLRPKIAGFFRRRMEKGPHLASYAYAYVPRSRPLFREEDTHTFERGVLPAGEILLCEILAAERSDVRAALAFGKSL